jgi:hypothetical protein
MYVPRGTFATLVGFVWSHRVGSAATDSSSTTMRAGAASMRLNG